MNNNKNKRKRTNNTTRETTANKKSKSTANEGPVQKKRTSARINMKNSKVSTLPRQFGWISFIKKPCLFTHPQVCAYVCICELSIVNPCGVFCALLIPVKSLDLFFISQFRTLLPLFIY